MTRKPTQSERARFYEDFLFRIYTARQMGNHDLVVKLLDQISEWAMAHRDGNGTIPSMQVQRNVNKKFWEIFPRQHE